VAKQDLKGKVVVITGASSGFGKGTALELARAQAHLVLAARRADLLTELAHQCEEFGVQTLAAPTDVGDRKQVEDLCQSAVGRFGRIDVWINNAGVGALGKFEAVPLEDHVKVIETDLLGTLYGSLRLSAVPEARGGSAHQHGLRARPPHGALLCFVHRGEAWCSRTV